MRAPVNLARLAIEASHKSEAAFVAGAAWAGMSERAQVWHRRQWDAHRAALTRTANAIDALPR